MGPSRTEHRGDRATTLPPQCDPHHQAVFREANLHRHVATSSHEPGRAIGSLKPSTKRYPDVHA
jgi:hypothetical protein